MKRDYSEFLQSKMVLAPKSGIRAEREEISAALKPHQRDAVQWAAEGGRRAIFAAFGLGKTVMQLEWCRLIHEHKGGQLLIVCPLGVKQEFMRDAKDLLGMKPPVYVRNMAEVSASIESTAGRASTTTKSTSPWRKSSTRTASCQLLSWSSRQEAGRMKSGTTSIA